MNGPPRIAESARPLWARWLGFKWCPYMTNLGRHGWVWSGRRTTCPICAAYGRETALGRAL